MAGQPILLMYSTGAKTGERRRAILTYSRDGNDLIVAGTASGRMAQCLSPGGRLIVFGHLSGEPLTVRSQLLTGGGLSIAGFSLRPAEQALGGAGVRTLFADLLAMLRDRPVVQPIRAIVPLSRAGEAIALAREGRGGGVGRVLFDLSA